MPSKEELKMLQALPLEVKVLKTQQRIREWVTHFGVDGVYVSFSGGKDSTVLLHLVRELYPDIEAVFVNTGLEYPEIQRFVKTFDNVKILYPKKTFKQVISEYGYPMISKAISHNAAIARNKPDGAVMHNAFIANNKKSKFNMHKWIAILGCDFKIAANCCDIMKKSLARYTKKKTIKSLL